MPLRARQHALPRELQKQGNIHTSDDVITGQAYFRARVGGMNFTHRARSRTLEPPETTSEDLAEDLDELRRIDSAGETNWARVLPALHDEVGNAADPALRRLRTGSADVLLRRRRV